MQIYAANTVSSRCTKTGMVVVSTTLVHCIGGVHVYAPNGHGLVIYHMLTRDMPMEIRHMHCIVCDWYSPTL